MVTVFLGVVRGNDELKKGKLTFFLATGIVTIGLWDTTIVVQAAVKPQVGNVFIGGDRLAYNRVVDSITFQYSNDTIEYDQKTDTFKIPIRFGSADIGAGLDRYLKFAYSFNDELEGKVKRVVISPDGLDTAVIDHLDGNHEFSNTWDVRTKVGGTANAVIYMQAHKITPDDWIAVQMESSRLANKTPVRPAWDSTRVLEYKDFGPALNAKLLEAMKKKAVADTANDSKAVQAEAKKKIDQVKVDDDFAKVLPQVVVGAHKEQAKNDLDSEAAVVNAKIDNDPTLTASEKTKQKADVTTETAKAKTVVDQAQDDAGVKQARDAGMATIDAQHKSGTALDVRRRDAQKVIDAEVAKVAAVIDQDPTLATAEKDAQKQAATDEATKAKTAIDQAQTIEAIDQAKTVGIKTIDDQHQSRADFDKQKTQAKQTIADEATKVTAAIDQDVTLSATEKQAQKQAVVKAADSAKTAIDKAQDMDHLIQAKDDGVKAIDGGHQSGTALPTRQDAAKKALDAEAAKVTNTIDQDPTLTAAEKQTQKQAVVDAAAKAKAAIDQAQDADAVNQKQAEGIKTIDDQHQLGMALDKQKAAAKQVIDAKAGKVSDDIDHDVTLTAAEKKIQKQAVIDEAAKVKAAIDGAQNADAVIKTQTDGIRAVDDQHQAGTGLAVRKAEAQNAIDAEAVLEADTIDQDVTLTGSEKASQKQSLTDKATAAKDAITKAQNIDEVNQAATAGIQAIDAVHQPGTHLDTRKTNAKQAIDAKATQITQAIDQDVTLTGAEKATQKQTVVDEATKAKTAVDAAKDADAVDQAQADGSKAIDGVHQPGTLLDTRKATAKQAIATAAAKVTAAIDQDVTLISAEKATQKQAVVDEATKANQAIDAAKDADAVDQAKADGSKYIGAKHQTGTALTVRRDDAKKTIDAQAAKTSEAIDHDATLTAATKKIQKQAVAAEASKAKTAIDAAKNADGVDQTQTAGIKAIKLQHQSGQTLSHQRADAKKLIADEAAKATTAIDHDVTLTTVEKKVQKQAVAVAVDKANQAIDAAKSADAVNQAQAEGIKNINNQHQSGQAIATRKDDAKQAIDVEAGKVAAAIDQDVTLTGSEKQTQKQAMADEAAKAKAAIDSAQDADGVDQIQTDGIQAVNAQHQSGTDLTIRKTEAQKMIDAEAALETDAINQDATLTSGEKAIQKQAVTAKADEAKAAIAKAQNVDAVIQAEAAGIKAIDAVHQSGTLLSTRKTAAKQAIDAEAAKVGQLIAQDVTLTTVQKAVQKQAVANEATKAKATIDQSLNADAVDQAKAAGIKTIDAQYHAGAKLDMSKAAAKKAIDVDAASVVKAIDRDVTLTGAEKTAQKQAVVDEATNAKTAIDAAKDADSVDQSKADGIKQIEDQHQPGTSLTVRKAIAKKAIDKQAAKVSDAIDHDATLTAAVKKVQKRAVADEAVKAKTAIDTARSADTVDQAQNTGIKVINAQHQAGKAVAARKDDAKQAIDTEAAKVAEAVDHDTTLTASEKSAQKQAVADEAAKVKMVIDGARNADGVDQAQADGIQAVDAQHQSGTDLATRQAEAQKTIDAEAALEIDAINQDVTLTSNEKASQKQQVTEKAKAAKDAIAKAQDADAIKQAETDGIHQIDAVHQSEVALNTRKTDAKKAIDAEAAKVGQAIDQDVTLTDAQKTAQKQAVAAQADKAKQAIDAVGDADAVDQAKANGIKAIDAQHQSSAAIATRQTEAKQAIDAEAAKVMAQIDRDNLLSDAQKAAQKQAVTTQTVKAKQAIDAASSADAIEQAKADGIKAIDAQYQAGKAAPTVKAKAKAKPATNQDHFPETGEQQSLLMVILGGLLSLGSSLFFIRKKRSH